MVAELLLTEDREFETAGAVILNANVYGSRGGKFEGTVSV